MLRRASVALASASVLTLAACDDSITAPATSAPADASSITTADVPEMRRAVTSVALAEPALPAELALPTDAVVTGKTFRATDVAQLNAALVDAKPGDQILLTPGVSYVGAFRLRDKGNSSGWITVRTDGTLPSSGTRVTPAMAQNFAKLVSKGRNDPAISADAGTTGWRFVGVEVMPHDSIVQLSTLIRLGDGSETAVSQIPSDIVFDRTYIHGNPKVKITRCVYLNSARSAVVNSTVVECHNKGNDSPAIGIVGSPGPLRIENNSLSGAGMGIFIGGTDPKIQNLTPSDITIRGNHVWRPDHWKGVWTVKNLLEIKHAKRVMIERNLFENNWVDGQAGSAILFKSVNQSGKAPWSQTADVTFRLNVVRNSPHAVNIGANPETHPAIAAARIKIERNLFYNIGTYNGTKGGRLVILNGPLANVQVLNNTMIHNATATHAIIMDTTKKGQATNFVMRGNIGTLGTYGIYSSGTGSGTAALEKMWRGTYEFENNVVVGTVNSRSPYPTGTKVLKTVADVGFTNAASGDYSLLSSALSSLSLSATSTSLARSASVGPVAGAIWNGLLGGELPVALVGGGL